MSWGETKKQFISVRPTPGSQWSSISKNVSRVPKVLSGLHRENVGRSWRAPTGGQRGSGESLLWDLSRGVLLAQGSACCLRGEFWFPSRMLCLPGFLPELREKLERRT